MVIKRHIRVLPKPTQRGWLLRVRMTWAGRQMDFYTGITVAEDEWSARTGKVVRNPKAAAINRTLSRYVADVEDMMQRYELQEERVPTRDELRRRWDEVTGKKTESMTMAEAVRLFIEDNRERRSWTRVMVSRMTSMGDKLDEFRPGLELEDFDDNTFQAFVGYLVQRRGMRNTTAHKNVGYVKLLLRWASEKGIYKGTSHETFKPVLRGAHFENKTVIFLTREEMALLDNYPFGPGEAHLERVRDTFMFSCYTGLRYSDCAALRPEMVYDGAIHITTKKTNDRITVQLNARSRAILERYGGRLPVVSSQKTNTYLHELCRRAGIDTPVHTVHFEGAERKEECRPKHELVTFHAARRTFVTQALYLGIPTEVIIKWTGHSSTDHLKPYLEIVEGLKEEQMAKFDTLLQGHEKDTKRHGKTMTGADEGDGETQKTNG